MRGRRMRPAIVAMAVWIGPLGLTPVSAQAQEGPLAGLLPELILFATSFFCPGCWGRCTSHTSAPLRFMTSTTPRSASCRAFNSHVATPFATFPLGSPAGSLTYVFDESLGTLRRNSRSFGPLFAERALTIGPSKAQRRVQTTSGHHNTFEGQDWKMDR